MNKLSLVPVAAAFALLSGCSFETNPYVPPKVEDEQNSPLQSAAPAAVVAGNMPTTPISANDKTRLLEVLERSQNFMPQSKKLEGAELSAMKTFFLTLEQ